MFRELERPSVPVRRWAPDEDPLLWERPELLDRGAAWREPPEELEADDRPPPLLLLEPPELPLVVGRCCAKAELLAAKRTRIKSPRRGTMVVRAMAVRAQS